MKKTTWVGLPQTGVSDWTVANLRTKCCLQNWGHVESKPTGMDEIWLISAEIHHCQSAESPVLPVINSSLLEFICLWEIIPLEYQVPLCACVCVQAENTAEKNGTSTPSFKMNQLWNQKSIQTLVVRVRCTLPTQTCIQQWWWSLPYLKFCITAGISSSLCWTPNTDFNAQCLHCHRQ